jgi:hypothetical protein
MGAARVCLDRPDIFEQSIDVGDWRRCGRLCNAKPLDAIEHALRVVERRPPLNGVGDEAPSEGHVALVKRFDALMKNSLRLALPLGLGAPRTLNVGASAAVVPIQEQDTRPEIDRLFVLIGEVLIEASKQQLLDSRVPLGAAQRLGRSRVGTKVIVG